MVTSNQKSTVEKHTKEKMESKHNTKDSHQVTREEKKTGRGKKKPLQKSNSKRLTKWQSEHTYQKLP